MPKQQAKSALASKLGNAGATAVDSHKADETTLTGGSDLPAGIEGGIAQLVECKFDKYKRGETKGEYFFYAAGVVVSPSEHDGISLKGLRTQIGPEPLCPTPNRSRPDVDSHVAWVLNEMRKLGVDTNQVGVDDLEDVATALREQKPHFRFRTWKGEPNERFPNPRVNHDWRGCCEYNGQPVGNAVVDETGESSEASDDSDVPFGDELDMLADKADNQDDGDAQDKLTERALAAGVTQTDVDGADSWTSVAALVRSAGGSAESSEGEQSSNASGAGGEDWSALGNAADEDDESAIDALEAKANEMGIDHASLATWTEVVDQIVGGDKKSNRDDSQAPEVGKVYQAKPTPRSKKMKTLEVTAVFEGAQTCNVKWLDTNKVQRAFPWAELHPMA